MQKATYLASILVDRVPWPAAGGNVVAYAPNKIFVDGTSFECSLPSELHSLLCALSYSPFFLHVSQPLLGKLDIWIKTSSLRSALRNEMQLPMEFELTQLFRMAGPRLIVSPPNDEVMTETCPSTVGKLVSSARFKVMDELFWDSNLGGFARGALPFDVPSIPLSLVFVPHKTSWSSHLLTDSFAAVIAKLPVAKSELMMLRTSCTLVIDNDAPPTDVRVLTMEQLQHLQFLRLRLLDYQTWVNDCVVVPMDGTVSSLLATRKALFLTEQHPRFNVHPYHVHWKAAIWPLGTVFQARVPRADWVFAVHANAESWATGFVANIFSLDHLYSQVRVPDGMPEIWNIVSRNSWRIPLQKKRLMVRLHFYEVGSIERSMFRDSDKMMASFGLVQKPDSTWCSKAGLLRLLKRDGVLAADRLDHCLEGFALSNAQLLLQPNRPQCTICATNACNSFLDQCGHLFCDTCLQQHVQLGGSNCPVCRSSLTDGSWTQVRRVTSRRYNETMMFAKQDQLLNLASNLRGSLLFVAPNDETARQCVQWCGPSISIQTPTSMPLKDDVRFDHIVCTTALLPSSACVKLLHQLFQKHSTDTTTLHVLVARGSSNEEDFTWVREFSKCYPNLIEMSMYA